MVTVLCCREASSRYPTCTSSAVQASGVYDSELIVGSQPHLAYRTSSSGCMSVNGVPDVISRFDHIQSPQLDYENRIMKLEDRTMYAWDTVDQITDTTHVHLDVLEGFTSTGDQMTDRFASRRICKAELEVKFGSVKSTITAQGSDSL